jgi:hypothetical protein
LEKKCNSFNGHCRISPFIDGGIIGEMGSIQSRTRARARAAVGGREAATLHAALNFGGESNWQASVR